MRSIYTRVSTSVILLISILSATSCQPNNATNTHLLSISVTGSEPYNINTLADKILAINNSNTENLNAYEILTRLIHHDKANNSLISINQINHSGHTIYKAVLIFNEIPDDDSISGYRYNVTLKNEHNNKTKWQVIDITRSWRCWPDRGHSAFNAEPCL